MQAIADDHAAIRAAMAALKLEKALGDPQRTPDPLQPSLPSSATAPTAALERPRLSAPVRESRHSHLSSRVLSDGRVEYRFMDGSTFVVAPTFHI